MNELDFTELCRACMPGLYRVSMSILRSEADAQDAVQQAMLKAWQARERVYPGHEQAWLMRIAVNECRSIQRQRMRLVPAEYLPEGAYTPPDTSLRDAVEQLPESLRLPLLLKYMEGMTEEEAARALGMTRAALKGRLFRARHALAKLLNEEVELP